VDIAIVSFLVVFLKILADCEYEKDEEKVYKMPDRRRQEAVGRR